MTLIERFQAYALAFEETYLDDNWGRLEPFFTEDATYEVTGIPAFDFRVEGRDAVFAGIRNVLDKLDRRCTSRTLALTAPPSVTEDTVGIDWVGTYTVEDAPDLVLYGREEITYRDGQIAIMVDSYPPTTRATVDAWFAEYGKRLK